MVKDVSCSFCGKSQNDAQKMVAGNDVYICEECVGLCTDIIAEESDDDTSTSKTLSPPNPRELKESLDDYIVGQERPKRKLAVAVHNHYKRVLSEHTEDDNEYVTQAGLSPELAAVELSKSNILLIGPTGSGKTLLARTLAKLLDVPFTIADATMLTEAGYVGEDVENIIVNLLNDANHNVERAERGIVYVDEIDKIARRGENPSITRDVSGEGVQQSLLKIIEGTECNVPPRGGRKHPQQDFTKIDTSNILFICGGAFSGLEKIIERRMRSKSIGFGQGSGDVDAKGSEWLKYVEPEDLLRFGLIPEFIGRLPIIATLDELDEDTLIKVMTEPKSAVVRQYQELLSMDGVSLRFQDDALSQIAKEATEKKTGARGLRGIIERTMRDVMYEAPRQEGLSEVVVNEKAVKMEEAPLFVFADGTNELASNLVQPKKVQESISEDVQ